MNENYIIKKSNYFIMNCSYDLSLEEQKLILTLASMVHPDDEDFKAYKFKISDFMKLLGVDTKTKYTAVPKITKELMKKVFEIEEDDTLIQTAWLSSATYKKGSGMVELEFSPRLKPYMLKLHGLFTQYKLSNILSMKSKYSPRIYEILKCNEFKQQGFIELEVDELRKLLKAENIYPLYANFKQKLLLVAQKELKEKTDISFTFDEIKTGRKITSLRFYIHKNINQEESSVPKLSTTIEPNPNIVDNAPNTQDVDVELLMDIMADKKLTYLETKKIYLSSNKDFEKVLQVYEYCKDKQCNNFVGLMISLVKPGVFNEPKKVEYIENKFRNFTETFTQYSEDELNNIIDRSQQVKYRQEIE